MTRKAIEVLLKNYDRYDGPVLIVGELQHEVPVLVYAAAYHFVEFARWLHILS